MEKVQFLNTVFKNTDIYTLCNINMPIQCCLVFASLFLFYPAGFLSRGIFKILLRTNVVIEFLCECPLPSTENMQ